MLSVKMKVVHRNERYLFVSNIFNFIEFDKMNFTKFIIAINSDELIQGLKIFIIVQNSGKLKRDQ